jgi:opacity protein-like surface antigen
MKRFLVTALTMGALVSASDAFAQRFYLGVKAGVAMEDLDVDTIDDTSMRTGFSGGGFLGYDVSNQFGFRLEALYVNKGAELNDPSGSFDVNYDFIEVPLLFVMHMTPESAAVLDLFAGPTLAFNISAETDDGSATVDISDETESFELGAAIGLGVEYKLTSMSIVGDARYSLGATDLANFSDPTQDVEAKSRGFGFMAGLLFPIGSSNKE